MPRPRSRAAVWRTLQRLILETANQQVDAINQLEQFAEADEEITRYQTAGQQLVEIIARDAADSESRELARRALTQLNLAGALKARLDTHIYEGISMVSGAHVATRQAMTLVTHWREGS